MAPITADSPYSLENFLWLMENSSVGTYLSEESLARIDQSLESKNEQALRELYPIILEEYVRERDININFALQHESLMNDFAVDVEKAGYKVKAELKAHVKKLEEKERREAEKILKKIE
ncbi:MAG TPA: hypothetical protein VI588_01300 [Candidatus Gracilibacteria bacterium]|nr:hypothetical protein [Candidatus Gracilibacteria bacterium]